MKLKVSFWFYAFFILSLLAENIKTWLFLFVMLLVHEGGHILMAKLLGYRITQLTLYPFGCAATIEHIDHGTTLEEMLILLCGVGMHVIYPCCFALLASAGVISAVYEAYLVELNASIFFFNLLPIYPLDGGRLIDCLTQRFFAYDLARSLTFGISVLALCALSTQVVNLGTLIAIVFLGIQLGISMLEKQADSRHFVLYCYLYPRLLPTKIRTSPVLFRNRTTSLVNNARLISEHEWLAERFVCEQTEKL